MEIFRLLCSSQYEMFSREQVQLCWHARKSRASPIELEAVFHQPLHNVSSVSNNSKAHLTMAATVNPIAPAVVKLSAADLLCLIVAFVLVPSSRCKSPPKNPAPTIGAHSNTSIAAASNKTPYTPLALTKRVAYRRASRKSG